MFIVSVPESGQIGALDETRCIGLISRHPFHANLSIDYKTEDGRGGPKHFHNVSYIGSSFVTIANSIDGRAFSLEQAEIDHMAAFDVPLSLDDVY